MKRTQKILFVVGTTALGLVLSLGTAHAQLTSTATNATSTAGDLTLTGTVQNAIVLTVAGVATTVTPTGAGAATVNFGTFNTQTGGVSTGAFYRNGNGAYVVASLTATVGLSGGSLASIDLSTGAGLLTQVNKGAPVSWLTTPAFALDLTTTRSVCPNGFIATDSTPGDCANGTPYAHDIGVYVPDTMTSGTTFSQVVHYAATMN